MLRRPPGRWPKQEQLPEGRVAELEAEVVRGMGVDALTPEVLHEAAHVNPRIANAAWSASLHLPSSFMCCLHGLLRVVRCVCWL